MGQGNEGRALGSRLGWIALGLWAVLAAVTVLALWHLRRDAIDSQSRELGVLSLALTDEVDRGLQGVQEGLQALRIEWRDQRLPAAAADRALALQTRAALMPLVDRLWLVDRAGRVVAASDAGPAPAATSFVPALVHLSGTAMAMSAPFEAAGEAAAGGSDTAARAMVAFAIRADGGAAGAGAASVASPGAHGGWIVAAMPARALLGAFSVASPAADARMAVFRGDGVRLAGDAVASDAPDDVDRLVSRHRLARFDLSVALSRDRAALLAGWRQTAQLAAAALLLLLGVAAASVRFVVRANRRRAEAQQALQAQRTRASKLESLGTLAGGVAHDFNNVLAAIVGFGEMAQDAAAPGSAQARHLDKVLQAALRGKALAERILAFSRGGAHASAVFELQPVVEEVLALLAASLRPGVLLERMLQAPGARVRGDATQAFEAVMNLCTNAMQAMPDGGRVGVELRRLHVAAPRVLSHSELAPGEHVALSVSDQGGGITPAVMDRLFEPFFTTRTAQSGTGLGLAVVHGVMAEFGGAIDVQSTPGHGARFTLYFPASADPLDAAGTASATLPDGRGRAVLVVDDEPTLVAMAEEMLRGLGYAPVGFDDPRAALAALQAEPQRFAAVLTDEVMPGLGGTQLTEALRRTSPDLPVLLVSGYGGASLAARAAAAGVNRVLGKPMQRHELARALAELLR